MLLANLYLKIQLNGIKKGNKRMELPEMILFDYGQTLVNEQKFDGIKGTEAVLKYAAKNKYNLTAEQIQKEADAVNKELGKFDPVCLDMPQIEVPNVMFVPYIYESQGIEIPLSTEEIDKIFWDAASPGVPCEDIEDFLIFLKNKKIRTGVISNISYSPLVVADRINTLLPGNSFEFIITSSNYIFRKPNKRIFNLALEKAGLKAENVWYIGDDYECDIVGALNSGIMPVWYTGAVDKPYKEKESIFTIKSWNMLEEKIQELDLQ